jgi:hypothetical protein
MVSGFCTRFGNTEENNHISQMIKTVEIRFLTKSTGSWFDLGSKSTVSGILYSFQIKDNESGEWILNVRTQDSLEKADVIAATTERTTSLHDQIKRKSMIFNQTSDGSRFYNVIGIGYVDDGRFHFGRISDKSALPEEIISNFKVIKYHEASPHKSLSLKDKMVALVDKSDAKGMALLFFLERINPVFKTI